MPRLFQMRMREGDICDNDIIFTEIQGHKGKESFVITKDGIEFVYVYREKNVYDGNNGAIQIQKLHVLVEIRRVVSASKGHVETVTLSGFTHH